MGCKVSRTYDCKVPSTYDLSCKIPRAGEPEPVWRSKKRKQMMRAALRYRKDFASAHVHYIEALWGVADALCNFSDRQLLHVEDTSHDSKKEEPMAEVMSVEMSSSNVISNSLQVSATVAKSESVQPQSAIVVDSMEKANEDVQYPRPKLDTINTSQPKPPVEIPREVSGGPLKSASSSQNIENKSTSPLRSFEPSPLRDFDSTLSPVPPSPPNYDDYVRKPPEAQWDPFNLFLSPVPRQQEEPWVLEDKKREWEQYQIQLAREEGMPDLEEDDDVYPEVELNSNPRMQQDHSSVSITEKSEDREVNQVVVNTDTNEKIGETDGDANGKAKKEQEDVIDAAFEGKRKEVKDSIKELNDLVSLLYSAFDKACQSAEQVSDVLEIQTADKDEDAIDFGGSFRHGDSISRNLSLRALLQRETNSMLEPDSTENFSLTLERLYRWEKKLYKEVKVWERLLVTFSKKSRQYDIMRDGKDQEQAFQLKLDIESLDSQITVTFGAICSASTRIQQITNEELHPELAKLIHSLKVMWSVMLQCHSTQREFTTKIEALHMSDITFKASEKHKDATVELKNELQKWQGSLNHWTLSQEKYINALLNWVKICSMDQNKHENDRPESPDCIEGPSIYMLLRYWYGILTQLKEKTNSITSAINTFVETLHGLIAMESRELNQTRHGEALLDHRSISFRIMEKRDIHPEIFDGKDFVLSSLQKHLPSIFDSLVNFAKTAAEAYDLDVVPSEPLEEDEET